MQKYINSVADKNGKPVTGALALVTNYPGGTTATIYSDNSLSPQSNPITTDANGAFAFYATDGRYAVQISGTGLVTQTISDILLEDPTDGGSSAAYTSLTVGGSPAATTATLAVAGAAATVGSTGPSTVQADINARPTSSTLAAPSGSSLVGFLQAGTGAVARTGQDKLRETVSVTDFFANGVSGALVDPTGSVDSTLGIQAAFDLLKGVYIPPGTYKISDSIKYRGYGRKIFGAGKELSIINQVTAGKPCIEGGSGQSIYRADISDLQFTGASGTGHAIYFPQLYESEISRITAYCGGSALKLDSCFSVKFSRIDASSYDSHGFDVLGNNTVLFESCYAHTMNTAGMAGFYVSTEAMFIACNCVDSGDYGFYLLGATSRFIFLLCNFEDFKQYGVYSAGGNTQIQFINCYWKPPSAATAPSGYQCSLYVTFADQPVVIDGCSFASKGATRLLGANVVFAGGGTGYTVNGPNSTPFSPFLLVGNSTVVPIGNSASAAFGIFAKHFNYLTCDRFFGFIAPAATTWTANSATFDVSALNVVKTANTVATNFTNATSASLDGQRLTIVVKDANTTIKHAVGGAGRFINKSGADIVATNGAVYEYVSNASIWQQVGP